MGFDPPTTMRGGPMGATVRGFAAVSFSSP
jgi:hypothetical protein